MARACDIQAGETYAGGVAEWQWRRVVAIAEGTVRYRRATVGGGESAEVVSLRLASFARWAVSRVDAATGQTTLLPHGRHGRRR